MDSFCPVFGPETPVETLQHLLPLPPRPQPDGWWRWPNVQEAQRRLAAEIAALTPPYPGDGQGRGVVVVGGGKYAAAAYVTVRVLRHAGCRLPIQVWHLAGEMDEAMRRLFLSAGAACVNADETARKRPFRFLDGHWWKGWQLKVYAIAHCPFREVLLLDADCYPTRNPEFLFDSPSYRACGAVFWPDLVTSAGLLSPDIVRAFGIFPGDVSPIESGQLLVDKERCWRPLWLALHYNAQADYTYRLVYGDKDTFPLAWKRLGRPHAVLWPTADWDAHTILQYDGEGRVLFQHRVQDKFTLGPTPFPSAPLPPPTNRYHPRLAHEAFCFRALEELRTGWLSWWHALAARWRRDDPVGPTERHRRHFQVKYDVAAQLRPRRLAEIGVGAGYSAFAFLSAVPEAVYVGVDAAQPAAGDPPGFFGHARTVLDGYKATLLRADTRAMNALPGRFDFVHVNGAHNASGCLHGLSLAVRAARHVLVSDYDTEPEVRRACRGFLAAHPDVAAAYIDDGLCGNLLLTAP